MYQLIAVLSAEGTYDSTSDQLVHTYTKDDSPFIASHAGHAAEVVMALVVVRLVSPPAAVPVVWALPPKHLIYISFSPVNVGH